ncbi:formylglycine-generating enzyme family protein [bacterium]|nr:formylglycine-generating enzyme family protein [bacterium]
MTFLQKTILTGLILFMPVVPGFNHGTHADGQESVNLQKTIVIDLPGMPPEARPLELILIEPGTFIMGSSDTLLNSYRLPWPPHQVTLTRPFYMSKREITQAQYEALRGVKSNRSKHRGPDLGIEKPNWYDAVFFIRRLNALNQGRFRLPSEAEWEYACRNEDAFGLENMCGGLAEWCQDRFEKSAISGPRIDPVNRGSWIHYWWPLTNRVVRGQTTGDNPEKARGFEQAIDYHYTIGFRVVMEVENQE